MRLPHGASISLIALAGKKQTFLRGLYAAVIGIEQPCIQVRIYGACMQLMQFLRPENP